MFRTIAHASLAMQTAFSCLLVCLLEFYYRRVAREPWLRWFTYSWVAQAAYVASLWVVFDNPAGGPLLRVGTSFLGFAVPATFALTSVALLRRGNPTRRWITGIYSAAFLAAAIRFVIGLPYPIDGVQASRIHNIPTLACYGLTSLLAALAFTKHGREQRLAGSLVTAAAWVLYGVFNLTRAVLWYKTSTWALYGVENNPTFLKLSLFTFIVNSIVWIFMSIGMGLLLTESAERSERRARKALSELQQAQAERGRLVQLVEQSHDAILAVSCGRVRYLNTAAASILGYAPNEIPSLFMQPLEEVCGIAAQDPMREQMEEKLAATRTWEGQSEWRNRSTGERIPMLVGAVAMDARESEPPSTGLIGRDLREHLRLEEELRQAQRQEALGRLAGGIAHDFNNLLTVMMGYAALVLQDNLSDRLRHDIGEILTAARRAAAITDRLRAFGRLQTLRPVTFELNAMIKSMRGSLDKLVDGEVELSYELSETALPVKADPAQIEQVLMNMILNAHQAIDGRGRIVVRSSPSRDFAQIQVEDTGCGMEPEVLEHIFDPYFTTRSAGTGLGLSMAYGIIRQSGGEIRVDSRPGQGSVFTVLLPKSSAEQGVKETAVRSGSVEVQGTELVMVVDDRAEVASLVTACLTRYGYRVVSYTDSESALAAVNSGAAAPQLVIRDVMMPGMPLRDFAQRMLELRPGLPMVCMSGLPEPSVTPMIDGTGAYFIAKPFAPDQLAALVRRVLDAAAILARE